MKAITIIIIALLSMMLLSCNKNNRAFDASGSFEAIETVISSEVTGTLLAFDIEEGQNLKAGSVVGYIDSTQLYLRKRQYQSQIRAVLSKRPQVSVQLAALQEQLKTAKRERERVKKLVQADAATPKQLDDATAQVDQIEAQIEAQRSSLDISTRGLIEETSPLQAQIDQIQDQINKCKIINPVNGTVLAKYLEKNEMALQGKPLYKIADLSEIILRAYVTGDQLPQIKINQPVKIFTDDGTGGFKEDTGTITWINDKSEFTPKTIQTKDERANMVYAIKVKVKNKGSYKIGMYGEVNFQ